MILKPEEISLTPAIIRTVLILALLSAVPHTLHLPILISGYFIALVIWRFALLWFPRFYPGRMLLLFLTLIGVILVYSQHHTLMGRDAGVSLLTLMLALKLMELVKRRDIYVVSFISYFILITQFLYNQTIIFSLFMLGVFLCLTTLLLEINRVTPSTHLLDPLKKTILFSLQALPIAAFFFILFPRLSSPLWHFNSNDSMGVTGFSERVAPGSISQLIQSSAVAFRVRFFHQTPTPENRYWRALVLLDTDGFEWFNQSPNTTSLESPTLREADNPIEYEVLLEPHYRNWLFALDLPANATLNSRLTQDYLLATQHPVRTPQQYKLVSYTEYITHTPGPDMLKRALALPRNITQQQQDLVQQWQEQTRSKQQLVQLALQHFNEQPFVYTLNPPHYLQNPVDEFLFEGKEGFCEHFATSFTQLMRLAGIPARLVVGYQGGELNPIGGYFMLRQSDAHAWSEVWFEGQGWTRIDPTTAVAPERISHSIRPDFAEVGAPALFQLDDLGILSSAARALGQAMDAANIGWRRWILDYNRNQQYRFLQNLGINVTRPGKWMILLLCLTGMTLMLIWLQLSLQGKKHIDPILKSYRKLCHKLAKIGLSRRPSEGPVAFSRRVAEQRPDLIPETSRIFDMYINLRYGQSATYAAAEEFHLLVRRFRPKSSRLDNS